MLQHAIIWSILYPVTLLGFMTFKVCQICWFLFNSPVDIWNMIGDSIKESEKQQDGTDNQRM